MSNSDMREIVSDFVREYERAHDIVNPELDEVYWRAKDILMKEATDSAKMELLLSLVRLAREDYLERNSDGETDCVTPYDIY